MEIMALDLGLRGATAGIFLMIVVVLLRIRPLNTAIRFAVALAAGAVAYVIATAPFVPKTSLWWTTPILAGNPVILWLWAQATFDDDFVVRRWHGALWLAVIAIGYSSSMTWTTSPKLAQAGLRSVSLVWLLLALSAALQTVRTWRADLIAGRRRLRIASLIASLVLIVLFAGSNLVPIDWAGGQTPGGLATALGGSLSTALGMFVLAVLGGLSLFQPPAASPALVAMAAGKPAGAARVALPAGDGRESIAPLLLRRLDTLMTVERIYRQEGLTIGGLAAKLDLPEHRLRQVINEGLGYRNFNTFLNRYRLDDAKAALADPGQRDVSVLTIAIDAGFQSIGPFNRAFKADTGTTPTEFRRNAPAQSQTSAANGCGDRKIGQSDREIG